MVLEEKGPEFAYCVLLGATIVVVQIIAQLMEVCTRGKKVDPAQRSHRVFFRQHGDMVITAMIYMVGFFWLLVMFYVLIHWAQGSQVT